MMNESAECPYQSRSSNGCPGLCNDKSKRKIAIAVAMDCITDPNFRATFADIDCMNDTLRRICGRGGRGIVVVEGITSVAATDYCMAVCCFDFAIYLMLGRWNARCDMTSNMVSTEWPNNIKSSASKFGRVDNIHRDFMEVEMA